MPLDKLVLVLIAVIAAAGLTVWIGSMAATVLQLSPAAWLLFVPAALVGYMVWRVIAERLSNSEDDHHDQINK